MLNPLVNFTNIDCLQGKTTDNRPSPSVRVIKGLYCPEGSRYYLIFYKILGAEPQVYNLSMLWGKYHLQELVPKVSSTDKLFLMTQLLANATWRCLRIFFFFFCGTNLWKLGDKLNSILTVAFLQTSLTMASQPSSRYQVVDHQRSTAHQVVHNPLVFLQVRQPCVYYPIDARNYTLFSWIMKSLLHHSIRQHIFFTFKDTLNSYVLHYRHRNIFMNIFIKH